VRVYTHVTYIDNTNCNIIFTLLLIMCVCVCVTEEICCGKKAKPKQPCRVTKMRSSTDHRWQVNNFSYILKCKIVFLLLLLCYGPRLHMVSIGFTNNLIIYNITLFFCSFHLIFCQYTTAVLLCIILIILISYI